MAQELVAGSIGVESVLIAENAAAADRATPRCMSPAGVGFRGSASDVVATRNIDVHSGL
jgi:hypothetical protein